MITIQTVKFIGSGMNSFSSVSVDSLQALKEMLSESEQQKVSFCSKGIYDDSFDIHKSDVLVDKICDEGIKWVQGGNEYVSRYLVCNL